MLPRCYPAYKTVHRRFHQWCRRDVLGSILTDLANALRDQGDMDGGCFIDATIAMAKGGGDGTRLAKRGQGVKTIAITDCDGLPLLMSAQLADCRATQGAGAPNRFRTLPNAHLMLRATN